ncbi:type II toxin-antitoxin system CcdA family antitoxin [Gluconacetobacter asukensis]|uniref:Type II toxin-antitoxin system CcdA family antitoxin n=1 Tax=Gluconacetobacter asukensis TaxID=1017181 RepID=A0A7W4P2Z4_9PROT|nr:type II toxin-antitoxin system CcdA family antitoxin [Gluconacetobacter asukensis]MBB2173383.1 type II toxin-antitoxin system CcdA family antitoxin [Gluconacetobacter asukensis]
MPRSTDIRRATNVTLPVHLLTEARALGLNISQACEQGLLAALAARRRENWLARNEGAIQSWNDHVEAHGLPLAAYRAF